MTRARRIAGESPRAAGHRVRRGMLTALRVAALETVAGTSAQRPGEDQLVESPWFRAMGRRPAPRIGRAAAGFVLLERGAALAHPCQHDHFLAVAGFARRLNGQ